MALVAFAWSPVPSHAQALGYVRIAFAKAALVVGAGAGRGVLQVYHFGLEPGRHGRSVSRAACRNRFRLA